MISLSETALSSITVPYFDFQCKDFRRKFYNIDDSFAHAIRKASYGWKQNAAAALFWGMPYFYRASLTLAQAGVRLRGTKRVLTPCKSSLLKHLLRPSFHASGKLQRRPTALLQRSVFSVIRFIERTEFLNRRFKPMPGIGIPKCPIRLRLFCWML